MVAKLSAHAKGRSQAAQRVKKIEKDNKLEHVMIESHQTEYLGSRVQCDGEDKVDLKYRIGNAQSVFCSLYPMWNNHRLPLSIKLRLYQTAICSTLTHADICT